MTIKWVGNWTGKWFAVALCLLIGPMAQAYDKITLYALFENKAILMVDEQRRVLSVSQTSPEGITLVSTDTVDEMAEIEFEGRRQQLRLGIISGSSSTETKNDSVTLWAKSDGHFHADGAINGTGVRFLVDTGATSIAMSSRTADRIGLNYKSLGKAGFASTASGVVSIYYLKLTSVQIGSIKLYNVDAGVIEGNHPNEILLGMSFLGQLNMRQEGDKLVLKKRY